MDCKTATWSHNQFHNVPKSLYDGDDDDDDETATWIAKSVHSNYIITEHKQRLEPSQSKDIEEENETKT